MSRIAKNSIVIPKETACNFDNSILVAKGKMGELSINISPLFKVDLSEDKISVLPINDKDKKNPIWGTTRAHIANLIKGVSEGFSKTLEMNGTGYRASISGTKLKLQLGYSHDIDFDIPEGIKIAVEKQTTLKITGSDKQLVGSVASKIKTFRKIEPYKGKGIREKGQYVLKKEGKKK